TRLAVAFVLPRLAGLAGFAGVPRFARFLAAIAHRLVEAVQVAVGAELVVVAFVEAALGALVAAAAALLLLANAGVGDHPEIVVGELEIVLGLDPVAVEV